MKHKGHVAKSILRADGLLEYQNTHLFKSVSEWMEHLRLTTKIPIPKVLAPCTKETLPVGWIVETFARTGNAATYVIISLKFLHSLTSIIKHRYDIFVHPNGEERFRSLSEVNRYLKRGKDGNSGWDMVYYKDLPLSHFTSRIARQQSLNYKNLVELEKDKREARNYAIAERRKNNDGVVVTNQTKKKKKKRGRPSNAADDEKKNKKKNKTKTKKKKSTVDAARETRIMELRSWTNQFTPGMMVRGVRA